MQLQDSEHPGRFRFCLTGSIFLPSENSGLDASALALKICHMIGALDSIPAGRLSQWACFIQSFQKQKERGGIFRHRQLCGFFIDPAFIKQADNALGRFEYDINTRRAVTRQACAALMCAGRRPLYPVLSIPRSTKEACAFLESLDWERDPWGAGSHVSHLLFFLNMNRLFFGMAEPCSRIIPCIFDFLNSIRDERTGSWYRGNPPAAQKINAAMKVLTGYAVLGTPVESPEPLIDFCLSAANEQDSCHNVDIIFVLHYCQRFTGYRRKDIEAFFERRVMVIEQFRKPDGAFSFYPQASQTAIYSVPIAQGLPESDIHGTTLMLWALVMIADVLGYARDLRWHMPIT